jgi:hypothetical protein
MLKDISICCKECGDAIFHYTALAICISVAILHSSQLILGNSTTAEVISRYTQHVYQQQIAKKNNFITLVGTNIFSHFSQYISLGSLNAFLVQLAHSNNYLHKEYFSILFLYLINK